MEDFRGLTARRGTFTRHPPSLSPPAPSYRAPLLWAETPVLIAALRPACDSILRSLPLPSPVASSHWTSGAAWKSLRVSCRSAQMPAIETLSCAQAVPLRDAPEETFCFARPASSARPSASSGSSGLQQSCSKGLQQQTHRSTESVCRFHRRYSAISPIVRDARSQADMLGTRPEFQQPAPSPGWFPQWGHGQRDSSTPPDLFGCSLKWLPALD